MGREAALLGDCCCWQSPEEGPEGIEFFVFEEEVAVHGVVFDHFLDNVLRFGDAARLAEAMRDAPVPIGGGTIGRTGKALLSTWLRKCH